MPHHKIALCGSKGSGKSTVFQSVIEKMRDEGVPFSGFKTFFLETGRLWLEWIHMEYEKTPMGEKTGKQAMKPFLGNLDKIGDILLQQDMGTKIFVADEIGFLEQFSKPMQRGIIKAITDAPFSFFTMKNADYPFIKGLKNLEGLQIFDLDRNDWQQKEDMCQTILDGVHEQFV